MFLTRFKYLLPVACVMLLMLAGSIFALVNFQQQQLQNETRIKTTMLHQNFQQMVLDETTHMSSILGFLTEDRTLQQEWQKGDIDSLMRSAMPIFQRIRSQHNITHFYFIAPDHKCILRLHSPAVRGDYIDRTTLDMAAHLNRPAYGLELGPLGTFALRVVHPWIVNGQNLGYLELAEDVSQLSSQVASLMGVNIICLVGKNKLDELRWKEGQRMVGRGVSDWNQFDDLVVLYSDIDTIQTELVKHINSSHPGEEVFSATIKGKHYMGGIDQLSDAGGNYVAKLIMLDDTSSSRTGLLRQVVKLAIFGVGLIIALLLLLHWRRDSTENADTGKSSLPDLPDTNHEK